MPCGCSDRRKFTAEVFANNGAFSEAPTPVVPTSKSVTDSPAPVRQSKADEIFTLKELSRKRKSDAMSTSEDTGRTDGLATNADEVGIPDEQEELIELKRAEKQARKEAKRAKKAEEERLKAQEMEEEEDFDYANAESVLHRAQNEERENRRNRGKGGKGKEKKEKAFDPYKKALDTGKGLPRAQRERAGRSMTFKK